MKLTMIIIICITGLLFFTGNTASKHSRDSDESQGEVQIRNTGDGSSFEGFPILEINIGFSYLK